MLTFANLGGDPEQEFLSDGLTGDIITELSRWRMLSVRPKAASSRYRGGAADPTRVARELEVCYVADGSVRRLGELDRARQYVAECLAANPGFSVRQFVSKEPFRNQADADHLAESVRLAGLPE